MNTLPHAIVDAHVHLWDVGRMRLSWWRPDLGLPRAVRPDALRAATASAPAVVTGAVAVQAADTVREARWLAARAVADPFLRAIVLQYDARTDPSQWAGMAQAVIDAADAGRLGARIAGIRLATPGGAADLGDVTGLHRLAEGLTRSGRVLELLIRPQQLAAAAALAGAHPGLDVVLCHLAAGGGAGASARWADGLAGVAAHPRAAAKVSGLLGAPDDDDRLRAVVAHAFAVFGVDRLMFGSDWPMSARAARYAEVVSRTASLVPVLTTAGVEAFWSGSALSRYAPAE